MNEKRKRANYTEAFKERYRWRSGIEATMSEYNKHTGVKHLKVKGFKAVRFCATLKAIGVNIFRVPAVRNAINSGGKTYGKHICNNVYNFLKRTPVAIAGITFVSWPN